MKKIGITTTVPSEILIAAGFTPVDLNNIFVTSKNHMEYIELAERDGFPKSLCAWIKGIYGVCIKEGIREVVGVIEGDCSNTKALVEVLELKGIKTYPFCYPTSHTYSDVKKSLENFMREFDVSLDDVEEVRKKANRVRMIAREIDNLSIKGKITGFENHLYQVNLSDFEGDIETYGYSLEKSLLNLRKRNSNKKTLRIGYIGVPPMTSDIYEFVESLDAKIIYNEVQREFAFPRIEDAKDIFMQYYDYTYVYDINFRIDEIKKQVDKRNLDALIHYTQSFCYRAIEDIVIKEKINIPILNIEGDKSNRLDARTKLRLEAFLDMLRDKKEEVF